ncbi:MAG: hypothetical protein ABI277_12635 [Burkholderiaceae bacterium]
MAAIQTTTPRTPPAARSAAGAIFIRAAALVVATLCAATGLAMAGAYPVAPVVAIVCFVAATVLAGLRFSIALQAMVALLPVTGFASITGWMTFEELDLMVLAASAGGYAALALRGPPAVDVDTRRHGPALSIFSIALIALFLVSTAISLERGIAAAGGFRFDWFQGYDDPLNSLRIFKSFAWVVLMAPLLLAELRRPGGFDRLSLGMTAGLGLATLAVLQERLAFTGLLDFSDDYRVTAPFWEMHVGGAALDGFLALTIPFAVREAVRNESRVRLIGAWVVLALAAYACLVTFSRGVYAAIPVSMLLLVVLVYRQRLRLDRAQIWSLLAKGLVFTLLVAASGFVVFRSGGYRAVLAAFLVLATAVPLEASIRKAPIATWFVAGIGALCLGVTGALVGGVLPKGPYLVFAAALAATVVTTMRVDIGIPAKQRAMLSIASWLWLAIDAVLVARHWGGNGAFRDSAVVLAALVALAFATARLNTPVWPERRHEQLATIGFAALVMGSVAVFTAGAYMGGRFQTTRGDLDVRIAHWTEGIGRLRGVDDWLFGKGLGRFPATSQFESPDAIAPGSYRIAYRNGERFLALTGPRLKYLGFGELFRFSQRVTVQPQSTYQVTMVARSSQAGGIHVELCEKMLLYNGSCIATDPALPASPVAWQTIRFPLRTGVIGGASWYAPRPVYFAIATGNPGAVLEVRSLQMVGPDGIDVIANGDFSNRTARWFSSSDKWHLPWHIKNLLLDVLFDQGVFGLALFALLVAAAFLRTTVGRAFRHPDAPYVAAAIAGYFVVGAFDSLLDVPRVAFLFYVVTLAGLMLRNPRAVPRTPTPAPAAVAGDEAAARARRRQLAFGERINSSRT